MNFDLSDDQRMLVETARGFAKKSSPVSRFRDLRADKRGFDRAVWRQMGELGWLGVAYPESVGGFGGRFIDAALIIEHLASTLVPEPYLASAIAGGFPILLGATTEQQQRWLPELLEGKTVIALAASEAATRYDVRNTETTATRDGEGYRLSGRKRWVLAGHEADQFVVPARVSGAPGEPGVGVFVVDARAPGVSVRPVTTMDGQRAAMVDLDRVVVGEERRLAGERDAEDAIDRTFDAAAAGACAEAVGIAQTVLDMTVDYLKTREQFGVKIGTFQALQHRAVDMFVATQVLRSQAIEACLRVDEGIDEDRALAVSAAKVQLSTRGRYVVKQAIQLHGGIGLTEEHDVGLYFKRMQVLATLFGDENFHVGRYSNRLWEAEQAG